MAVNDVKVVKHPGPVLKKRAEDRTTSGLSATMKPGEPVVVGGTGANFAHQMSDGSPVIGSDEFLGIVNKESDETSSADGHVEIAGLIPMRTTLRADANTSTNVDTASELNGLLEDWVTFDYDGTNYTIDENEGTDPNVHGLKIVDGSYTDGYLDVVVHVNATAGAPLTGQTMD